MHDQAHQLRRLVLGETAQGLAPAAPPPPLITVLGGKGGVGATTIAVNLTVAIAAQGRRAVLVDANLQQPDVATQCRLDQTDTLTDVLSGRRTVHEVLQRGPAGILVLPGAWAPDRVTECSELAQRRLLVELSRLGPHTDVVVLDAGCGLNPIAQRFAQASDLLLMVTSTDSVSIMDTYATIKTLPENDSRPPIRTIVNQSSDPDHAADVHRRVGEACHRFLGQTVEPAATVPSDAKIAAAAEQQTPLMVATPQAAAAQRIDELARHVLDFCRQRESSPREHRPWRMAS